MSARRTSSSDTPLSGTFVTRSRDASDARRLESKLVDLPRDKNGLYIQPKEITADREVWERHNRDRAAAHGFYADQETGNPHTVDRTNGRYQCGTCNMERKELCIALRPTKELQKKEGGVGPVNTKAGSCEHYEEKRACDPELRAFNQLDGSYGVAANGQGFGCPVCPYAEQRVEPDTAGRTLWCRFWATAVSEIACCKYNDAPTIEGDDDDE